MKIPLEINRYIWLILGTGILTSYLLGFVNVILIDSVNSAIATFFILLTALFSWDGHQNWQKEQLKKEFKLFTKAQHLIPEQLGFKKLQPSEDLDSSQ